MVQEGDTQHAAASLHLCNPIKCPTLICRKWSAGAALGSMCYSGWMTCSAGLLEATCFTDGERDTAKQTRNTVTWTAKQPGPCSGCMHCWDRPNRREDPYLSFHSCPKLQHQLSDNLTTTIPVSVSGSSKKSSWTPPSEVWTVWNISIAWNMAFYNRHNHSKGLPKNPVTASCVNCLLHPNKW